MEIHEAKELKRKLQYEILYKLKEFQSRTDLGIKNISIITKKVSTFGGNRGSESVILDVDIEVSLE